MSSIKESWAKEDLAKLESCICNDDIFGANQALGRMTRTLSQSEFSEGFQRSLENACHGVLFQDEIEDGNEEKKEASMMMLLNSNGARVTDACSIAAKLAVRWNLVDAMKDSAQSQADSLLGAMEHFEYAESC